MFTIVVPLVTGAFVGADDDRVIRPARSCVAVRDLPKGVLCEIEAIAVK